MKQISRSKCPKCGSEEFITQPNQYDCLRFVNGEFQVEKSELINENLRVFCCECGDEVDKKASFKNKRIVLRVIR